jgi:hypothetical protein
MYPAEQLENELYTYEDLPDNLDYEYRPEDITFPTTVFGEFTKLDPPSPSLSPTGYMAYYIGEEHTILAGPNNDDQWTFIPILCQDNNLWIIEPDRTPLGNESQSIADCLIGNYGRDKATGKVKDQFADTYTVTINPPDDNAGTYTVTRRSICVWSTQVEESGEPAGLKLSYIDAVIGGGFAYTWQIELDTSYIKDGFANTPTGDYTGGNAAVS